MCLTTSKKVKAQVQPLSVEDEVFAIGLIAEGVPDTQKKASADSKAVVLMYPARVGGNRCQLMAGRFSTSWIRGTGQYPAL